VSLPSESYAGHDHDLFVDVDEDLVIDGKITEELQELAEVGQSFLNTLYCARSLAKAIPQAKNDQANREQLYLKSVEILKPVVDTMGSFLQYHKQAIDCLVRTLQRQVEVYVKGKKSIFLMPNALVIAVIRWVGKRFCFVVKFPSPPPPQPHGCTVYLGQSQEH